MQILDSKGNTQNTKEMCNNCKFSRWINPKAEMGICCRFPPSGKGIDSHFPSVAYNSWCGEYSSHDEHGWCGDRP